MNRSLITALAVGAVAAIAGGAIAGYRMRDRGPRYAEVLAVSPVTERVRTPHEVCKTEEVRRRKPERDPHDSIGAAAGGRAGDRIGQRVHPDDTYTTTEQHCARVYETREAQRGYEVRYRLNGIERRIRMDHDPGARIPVRDGQLILDAGARSGGTAPDGAPGAAEGPTGGGT